MASRKPRARGPQRFRKRPQRRSKAGRKSFWPDEEAWVSVGIRLPLSVHKKLTAHAKGNFRSLNAELTFILAKALKIRP